MVKLSWFENDWLTTLILFSVLVMTIVIAEKLRIRWQKPPELTRKLVHILTGSLILITPYLLNSSHPLILLAAIFTLLNFYAVQKHILKGMHDTGRRTYGTVFYPLALLILLLTTWNNARAILQISFALLVYADSLAAIVGESISSPHEYRLWQDKKSVEGSLVMFVASLGLVFIGLRTLPLPGHLSLSIPQALLIALLVACLVTVAEAFSKAGSDNLSIPLVAAISLHYLLSNPANAVEQLALGMLLALGVALLSLRFRFLTPDGASAAFFLGTLLFGIGGIFWTVPILFFFFSSSLLSKITGERKRRASLFYEKSSRRDMGQVVANGGLPGLFLLLFYFNIPGPWAILYLGALAAVTADTWATEIGGFSRRSPRLITNLKRVSPGTSGAVSPLGTAGAILGSILVALTGFPLLPHQDSPIWAPAALIALAGVAGSLFDSLLGATIQAQFVCPECGYLTERKTHCSNVTTQFRKGFRWCNNDAINFFCALFAALLLAAWVG